MLAEPLISFFLLRSVRNIFKNTNTAIGWNPKIKLLLYGIGILFLADLIFHIDFVTKWIWHGLLIGVIITALVKKEFMILRTLMYAVLPFASISLLADVFKVITADKYKSIETYFDVASVFAIVWMIAMIFISRKQQKALRIEHEKALQQEEQNKLTTARKE